ncbi:MAG: DUF3343 domain-containing protein [Gemmatimonadota bacterium]
MRKVDLEGDPGLFLFESTTHVFWAEEAAQEEGVAVEVVPAPPGMKDLCGLALRTTHEGKGALESVLRAEGIPFRRSS